MPDESSVSTPLVDWAVAARAIDGEPESGDAHFVRQQGQEVLLGVVDGLGHGPEAAAAARRAVEALGAASRQPLPARFQRCHEQLRRTRGVVMSLVEIDGAAGRLRWVGVGNIEALLLRAGAGTVAPAESIILFGGVLGHQMPKLRVSEVAIEAGDVVVMATDGIRGGFRGNLTTIESPQTLASRVLEQHRKEHDDALVLVARFDPGE